MNFSDLRTTVFHCPAIYVEMGLSIFPNNGQGNVQQVYGGVFD
jgi:hypothetical protein